MDKKVGTITFHWATNYGAVMQAFALQKYLLSKNVKTEIINYIPLRTAVLGRLGWIKSFNFKEIKKEWHINKFRNNELILSERKFYCNNDLTKISNTYSSIITGSDQVWNKGFTLGGEGKTTLSYFLNFASERCKRFSYAASFGFENADEEYIRVVKDEISKFSSISVREFTGLSILEQLNTKGVVVCDPTLLLDREVYDALANKSNCMVNDIFPFILHKNQHMARNIVNTTFSVFGIENNKKNESVLSVYDWLKHIRDSKVVVTNSFHAVIFALIFNTPFVAVPVAGSKMNDRITTILSKMNLLDRFIEQDDYDRISRLYNKEIDWSDVNDRLICLRKEGQAFLDKTVIDTCNYE